MVVTDRTRFPDPEPGEVFSPAEWKVLEAVLDAEVGAVQLREKDLDGGDLYRRATALVDRVGKAGTRILVNDRIDIALAAGAHGVHLPQAGFPGDEARGLVGPDCLVGRSIHGAPDPVASMGCDYLIFGPIFDTPSKRAYGTAQGLERLGEVVRESSLPVVAIGGVTPDRVEAILARGACGVAVMGAVLSAAEPAAVLEDFQNALLRY